ncbi:MAG: hypothetical protein AAB834_07355, partial [Patescibacteria group bacterium]
GSATVIGDVVGCTGDVTIIDCDVPWPTANQLRDFYRPQTPYPTSVGYSSIDTFTINPHTVGPIYRNGDLNICSSSNGGTLTLTDTIYVNGDMNIGGPGCGGGNGTYTIDMNGQTIYVTGDFEAGNKVTLKGAGAIIVADEIKSFQPIIAHDDPPPLDLEDFLFVMSVSNRLHNFQPTGEFYGSVVGSTRIVIQGNTTLTHHSPPLGGLNVPTENMGDTTWTARNWSSSQ